MAFPRKLIIDSRFTTNGKPSNINMDNPVNMNDWLDYQLNEIANSGNNPFGGEISITNQKTTGI